MGMLAHLLYKQFYFVVKWIGLQRTVAFGDFCHFVCCLDSSFRHYVIRLCSHLNSLKGKADIENPFGEWCHWRAQWDIKQNPSICGISAWVFPSFVWDSGEGCRQSRQLLLGHQLSLSHKLWGFSEGLKDNDVICPPKKSRMLEMQRRKPAFPISYTKAWIVFLHCEKC